ncbi:hypothetical protein ABW21_db0204249 [Orbilia brochopaga]|nr:hypothetical protein ABW21_db0204249 [Drechslerella brochopaga]
MCPFDPRPSRSAILCRRSVGLSAIIDGGFGSSLVSEAALRIAIGLLGLIALAAPSLRDLLSESLLSPSDTCPIERLLLFLVDISGEKVALDNRLEVEAVSEVRGVTAAGVKPRVKIG